MNNMLPLIWAGLIAFGVIVYVILDGFDLGIGILFPWVQDHEYRSIMMDTIAPVWDGNETWLVFGGATLYGAFPLAYSTLLPALYMPIMVMLGSLVFRGVAFEFRIKAHKSLFLWDLAFAGGSTMAAFCQGLILGTFIQGYFLIPGSAEAYGWLTPFSMATGIAVVFGYALLGSTWLIMKTENNLQKTMYQAAKILLFCVAVFMFIVSIWTPFIHPDIKIRWFSLPNFFYLLPLPAATIMTTLYAAYCLKHPTGKKEGLPFILSVLLFIFGYIGLGISTWPYIVPRQLTLWEAAANPKTLLFQLVGAIILLPLLITYSIYAYTVFRGKVHAGSGYH
ncbi:MAG: cytochrome d ubiquinol oxidase subunit II [Gammaproteobacteria bacterium]|nr:cytochrome d ubiquinol oxidase subunit II [Gammaproteobacteria bacterium]